MQSIGTMTLPIDKANVLIILFFPHRTESLLYELYFLETEMSYMEIKCLE